MIRKVATVAAIVALSLTASFARASELRRTPVVDAVAVNRDAIVNIHGEKVVDTADVAGLERRRVNGMGTGVVVDGRGYVVTNHHVVDGVKKIMVTTANRETYVAELLSHDPVTDLAVIKINADRELPTINIGTSSDLMLGEPVIAVGNAFGYEHTVTVGIISALHRTVQVSDAQNYEDLIQTDASINPGNSGGPLLNVDGQMVGINVAVRAGAQGIGFAIPADKVVSVAADLISTRRLGNTWHGLVTLDRTSGVSKDVVVREVDVESPAAASGFQMGDVITAVGTMNVARALDLERAMIGHQVGESIEVTIRRDNAPLKLNMTLAAAPARPVVASATDPVWDSLGLRLEAVPSRQFQAYQTRYRGGLAVTDVRADGPAARQGIRAGDVLVGMHVWETVSPENVTYILSRPDFARLSPVKFYILRGSETLYGHLTVAQRTTP